MRARNPDGTRTSRGMGATPWILGALVLAAIVGFLTLGGNDGDRTASQTNTPAATTNSGPSTTGSGATSPAPTNR